MSSEVILLIVSIIEAIVIVIAIREASTFKRDIDILADKLDEVDHDCFANSLKIDDLEEAMSNGGKGGF